MSAAILLALLASAALGWHSWRQSSLLSQNKKRLEAALPHLEPRNDYVSSQRCDACHPAQHASWHRTFHRTMTQPALPQNIIGDFDGATVWSNGLAYRVFREGDRFWAEMPDPDELMYVVQGGKKLALKDIPRVRLPVVMATGSHHYQTYWVASPRYPRLMQTLPLVYLVKAKRWIPREAAFMRPPGDTGGFVTQWNHHCIRCHSTGGNPGLDAKTGQLDTSVAELGISCEACHGPAKSHVEVNQNPVRRYRAHVKDEPDPSIVNPSKLDHRLSSHVCGQCHGVFIMRDEFAMKYAREGELFRPGDDLEKTRYYIQHPTEHSPQERRDDLQRNPQFFRERWWDDGTILAGGREFTAMSVSGCYTRGTMSCLSCHSMHESDPVDQLKPRMNESAACTQCHNEPKYTSEISSHAFHAPESSGSNCLNCHMPHTTYALFSAIRSHQVASPNLTSAVRHGVPNACNLCHLDKTLAWTQEHLSKRYRMEALPLTDEQKNVSAALLWLLKGHAAQRVIAAWHVGWEPAQEISGTQWLAPFQAQLLKDPYGVVRYVAEQNLRKLPGFSEFRYDFLAPDAELQRAVDEAIAVWQSQRQQQTPKRVGREVLIDSAGQLMETEVAAFLRQRDNRPITIKE